MRVNRAPAAVFWCGWAIGCSYIFPIETPGDVADALKRRGIAFESVEPVDTASFPLVDIDEGVSLRGEATRIEIYLIRDPDTFGILETAGGLANRLGGLIGRDSERPVTYMSSPFVVVIIEEPDPGKTVEALRKIIPPEDDATG